MTIKGPDGLKSPLAGGQADLSTEIPETLKERAKELAQLRTVSDEAAAQFADSLLPKVKEDQTDGLFGPAFLVPPFGWIDRMRERGIQKGNLPGNSTREQIATGFKQLYAQATHHLHRVLEGTATGVTEQELVPIQKALARIDEVLELREKLTMLGQRSEMNRALNELDRLADDLRTAIAPLVNAIEVRDRVALGEKMKHLGQGDEHPVVDLDALKASNTSPAAFERYRPGDVMIIGETFGKKPIFGTMLDQVDSKDGPVARVLTLEGDRIVMKFVTKAEVEGLNRLKLNDRYVIGGVDHWVAPDRENGIRVATFDSAHPGRAPVDIPVEELGSKILPRASQVAIDATQAILTPTVIQAIQGHSTPQIMVTSNALFDGAAWSSAHLATNDDAIRVGQIGKQFAAIVADQVGNSVDPAQVSTAVIEGIWGQLGHEQTGAARDLMERGSRVGASNAGSDHHASTSLTAGVLTRTKDGVKLDVGHAGNTQLIVIRNGSVLFKTQPHVEELGITADVRKANNPSRTIGHSSSERRDDLLDHSSVVLEKGDVVLLFSNGVRNLNLLEQTKSADRMAQPHTEFTPFQLAEEVGARSPEQIVAAIRDLAIQRVQSGSGKAADLSLIALEIK
jgi:hypothetical protein